MKKLIIIIGLLQITTASFSQSSNPDSVISELKKINAFYDSAVFLGFDVNVLLTSDTVAGVFEHDHQTGTYMLNGKNVFYRIGETEYMQDDSFAITTYNQEHIMYVTKQMIKGNSSLFPINGFSDSAFQFFLSYYNVSVIDSGAERSIHFITDSASVLYKTININFYPGRNMLSSFDFSFKAAADAQPANGSSAVPELTKTLSMKFDNYHFLTSGDVFNYRNYLFYDRERHEYLATGKYKGYKVITSNLENTVNDFNDIEVPATPPPIAN